MTADTPTLYRVGRKPDPFHAWDPGESKNHRNRYDDPRGEFGVLYVAEQRPVAFLETLSPIRPDNPTLAKLAALPDGDAGDDTPHEAGVVDADWHLKRLVGTLSVAPGQRWLDVRDLGTREMLRRALASTFTELNLDDFDMGDALTRRRDVTQAIARWAYEHGYHGVIYQTRFDSPNLNGTCWAIFEGSAFTIQDISSIARDDEDMLAAIAAFHLRIGE